jgi:hypothetical protein
MELVESHFASLDGNLYYDFTTGTYDMFSRRGKPMHLNYLTFKELFKNMSTTRPLNILESGIASAGTQSTYLFNEFVRKYGGRFWSVDVNPELVSKHAPKMCPATSLVCQDSVAFFNQWVARNEVADVVYLDSWDLDFYNPEPAGVHGLNEYRALVPAIRPGSLMLIDDTPSSPYWIDGRGQVYADMIQTYTRGELLPGKGMYVLSEPKNATVLMHNYQVLYKFN